MIPSIDLIEPRRRRLIRWVGAATLISAIHIGGGSFAMFYWREDLVEEVAGAVVVEIAPVATALSVDQLGLPPGPLAEDGMTSPPASDPKIEKIDQETPTEKLTSPAPEPEVVLPKPAQAEDKPIQKPSPPVMPSQQQVAANKTAAPLRIEGDIAAKSAAPEVGTSTKDRRSIVSWRNSIVLHLNKNKRYPAAARLHDIQGEVSVRFVIDRSGQLVSATIVRGSGNTLLDEEALAMLKRASPLPRPPPAVFGELHELVVPIRFRIQ